MISAITSVSLDNILELWTDLMRAYYDNNSYGGDTAEIYAYRFQHYRPSAHGNAVAKPNLPDELREVQEQACLACVELVERFEKQLDCKCTIDDMKPSTWAKRYPQFAHRCHIRVIHKQE